MEQALAWLSRWGVSLASLGGGLLTLLVFRRGLPNVGWIVGYLLLLWLLFAVFIEMRQALAGSEQKSRRLIVSAVDYTIQTLYHGLLLFVLPAYYAAATLTSLNGVFLALLVALALLTTIDPWYRAIVQPRPWLSYLFFVMSIFAPLNVALPLVGVPPFPRSEEHTSELQSHSDLVCRLLLEKKKKNLHTAMVLVHNKWNERDHSLWSGTNAVEGGRDRNWRRTHPLGPRVS